MVAYSGSYVSGAQVRLGSMLDFAANGCACDLETFYQQFLASSIAIRFEAGEPAIVARTSKHRANPFDVWQVS